MTQPVEVRASPLEPSEYHILTCSLTNFSADGLKQQKVPRFVSLGWSRDQSNVHNNTWTDFKVPVKAVVKRNSITGGKMMPKNKLAVCLVNLFGAIDPREVVEWIEIHRILGVSHVTAYNRNLSQPALQVLKNYSGAHDNEGRDQLDIAFGWSNHSLCNSKFICMQFMLASFYFRRRLLV